jgi:alpha-glucosidase (family GH31 glycosyl hydrolase)
MLGECILVAPAFSDSEYRDVYLPGVTIWTHMWTGVTHEVGSEGKLLKDFLVMFGQPAVFYRDTHNCKVSEILSQFKNKTKV